VRALAAVGAVDAVKEKLEALPEPVFGGGRGEGVGRGDREGVCVRVKGAVVGGESGRVFGSG
jgi:hypothetical protein